MNFIFTYTVDKKRIDIMMDEQALFGHDFRRANERKNYGKEIVFSYSENIYRGIIKDISLGGAHINTTSVNQLSIGDIVTISIPYTSGQNNLKRRGRVVWVNNSGFAIEFIMGH